MPYDLIIFDCDGTLVDTELLNIKAIIDLAREYGAKDLSVEYGLMHFSGHRFSSIIEMISEQSGATFPDNASKLYLQRVADLSHEAKKIAYVHEMVEAAQKHAAICVASNGERNNVLTSLERENLRHFFDDDEIITGLMAKPKPAPDLFLLAAEKKNIDPSKALVIEDSLAGITGAKAANMDTWGFCGTHHAPAEHGKNLMKTGANATYNTMQDMIVALEDIFLNEIQNT